MNTPSNAPKRKHHVGRIIILSLLIVIVAAAIFLYNNFNRLLSESLLKSFNSSLVSEVYELKFENLRVNLFDRSIRVFNVTLLPREKPLHEYPYINSSFRLTTEEILLDSVILRTLLKENKLNVKKISITRPVIELTLRGKRHIMLPFKDSTAIASNTTQKDSTKKSLESFGLKEFQLIDAAFHVSNAVKEREFTISGLNISLDKLRINQIPGEYLASFDQVVLSIGELKGDLKKGPLQHIGFKDFKIGIDSLRMQLTLDTLQYRFHDFSTRLHDLDIQTADSLFHLTLKSFDLSYENKSIELKKISFKPNVSHEVLQRDFKYQHTEFSGTVGTLTINQVNFDSLVYVQKLFIDEVVLDSVRASIFKDKTKPLNKNRMPIYLGQTVRKISMPLRINHVKAMHVNLENTERKPDSTLAKVNITRATMEVKNITNLSPHSILAMKADAWLEGKAHFKATLGFYYLIPQFDFEGSIEKFNLPDLTPLIQAYTPAKINKGIADEISFSGIAEQTRASGTFKFLYHDLEVDLELKEQAKWKSSVLAFAANTALNSSNPGSADLPPRVVKFKIERDMNKGFVNVVIKSILNGMKETMIMSKENRKTYKQSKKESRQANKK